MLTDYLITVCCGFFAHSLLKGNWFRGSVAQGLWGFGFLFISIAGLTGGSFHGFAAYLTDVQLQFLWNLTVFLIGLTGGMMFSGFCASVPPRREPAARWQLAGVILSGLAGLGLWLRVGIHEQFNHNDVYHSIQLVALYLFYRGAIQLKDRDVYRSHTIG